MQTYAPAPVTVDRDWRMLIGGSLVGAEAGDQLDVVNPAIGEVVTRIPLASTADVDRAVEAAHAAFKTWRAVPMAERANRVFQLADLIEANGEELAWIDTIDNGSPIRVMRGDYKMAVDQLRYFAGQALALRGETVPTPERDSLDFTLREPLAS